MKLAVIQERLGIEAQQVITAVLDHDFVDGAWDIAHPGETAAPGFSGQNPHRLDCGAEGAGAALTGSGPRSVSVNAADEVLVGEQTRVDCVDRHAGSLGAL